jgi:arylformamidase
MAGLEIVDLSVAFAPGMPKFPAAWFPAFEVSELEPPGGNGNRRFTSLGLFAHNGTHVESSDHVLRDGITIDSLPLAQFAGYPVIVDLRDAPDAAELPLHLVRSRLPRDVEPGQVLLLMTGYDDRRWACPDFWERSPWLSAEAAAFIAALRPGVVGLDFQTEKPRERDFVVHRTLVGNGAALCEYLFNLDRIDRDTLFLALPIKIDGVEAAPVRAVGIKVT